MRRVLRKNYLGIIEHLRREIERDSMLRDVVIGLPRVPLELH